MTRKLVGFAVLSAPLVGLVCYGLHCVSHSTLGANLAQNFSRRSTHLLCPSHIGAKHEKAKEWDIPVIDTSWLAEILKMGAIPPSIIEGDSPPPEPMQVDRKGKGKAVEPEVEGKSVAALHYLIC
jgi:hypothetical protein